jgi:hypothetical protein
LQLGCHIFILCTLLVPLHLYFGGNEACKQEAELTLRDSGFRRKVDENFALVGYHAAKSGNFLQTFTDNLMTPSSGVKMGPISCPKTLVINYHYLLCNISEKRSSLLFRTYSGPISKENTKQESILHIILYWIYRLYGYHVCTPCEHRENATAVLCWRQNINT